MFTRPFLLFSLLIQHPSTLDYQSIANPILEWYRTEDLTLPGPKNDASSTMLWVNGVAHFFYNYWSQPDGKAFSLLATGRDLASLNDERTLSIGNDPTSGLRWFESILPGDDGNLYAFYHSEERNPCAFYIKTPEIGMAVSSDSGRTWNNLGIIIKNSDEENDCSALNGFFSNGTGDFSAVYDQEKQFVYILYSNYPMQSEVHTQGVAAARIAVSDLPNPVGKAFKWYKGQYSEPGIDGKTTPIFTAFKDFRQPNPDSFWGPSLHYNKFLKKYVMLMTRTKNGNSTKTLWPTEGIYVSTNDNLTDPHSWSKPTRIVHGGHWYPQFIGIDRYAQDHTSEIGEWARFFMEGHSDYIVRFKK